jgi:hypothetical protein
MKDMHSRTSIAITMIMVLLCSIFFACDDNCINCTSFNESAQDYVIVTSRMPGTVLSFEYPKGWGRNSPSYEYGYFIELGKPNRSYGGVIHTPASLLVGIKLGDRKAVDWIEGIIAGAKDTKPGLQIISKERRSIGQLNGYWLEYFRNPDPILGLLTNSQGAWPRVYEWEYLVDWEGKVLRISAISDEDLAEGVRADYLHLLNSFRIASVTPPQ